MNDNKQEPNINELKYMCERQSIKIEKLLDVVASHVNTISELQVDIDLFQEQIKILNKQLQEAQG